MLNKKEVEYNAMSLVSAWLFGAKDIVDLRLVFSGKDKEKIIPCTVNNAGQELANVLCNNKEGYVDTLDKDICERCFKLKYYGEYKEVSLTNKEYQSILSSIPKDSLVVYLTYLLSLNINIINHL